MLTMRPLTDRDVQNLANLRFNVRKWWKPKGEDAVPKLIAASLPRDVAQLYLAMNGDFVLRSLRGVAALPLLFGNGDIISGSRS